MKSSSMAAQKVVKMTTFSAASDENVIKMTTFLFQWETHPGSPPHEGKIRVWLGSSSSVSYSDHCNSFCNIVQFIYSIMMSWHGAVAM